MPEAEVFRGDRPARFVPVSSELMRTGFRNLMPNLSARPATAKLPSPDGTFPDFATSPTRIPHPYKVQHVRNRTDEESARRRRRFHGPTPLKPSSFVLTRRFRRIVAAAGLSGPPRCGTSRRRLQAPPLAAPRSVSQATAPSVHEPLHIRNNPLRRRSSAPERTNTTSLPSSRRGSDPPKPSRETGYG